MCWRRLVGAAVVALGVGLVTALAPGSAQAATPAGTIVFIKGYNVWLVKPDGSGQHQVTTDGSYASPYRSPSMSDAGIIAVGKGDEIVRMRQNGDVLNRLDPQPLPGSSGTPLDGPPVQVAISPDGARIAYTFVTYQCPIGAGCGVRTATGVTAASALSPPQLRNYFRNPSWVTNTRLMTHGGYLSQVMLQDLGGSAAHWFDDQDVVGEPDSTDLNDAALSRDGRRMVAVRNYGTDTHLAFYDVAGDPRSGAVGTIPTPSPMPCVSTPDPNIASPSFAPDNQHVVAAETAGLAVYRIAGAACEAWGFAVIAPGGSEPHWSPAALAPGKKAKPGSPATKKLTAKKKPRIKGTAKVGKRLKAGKVRWSAKPKKVTYRWLRNGKAIKGKRGAKRSYRVTRADRGKRLQVRIVAKRPGLKKATVKSKPVRVRR